MLTLILLLSAAFIIPHLLLRQLQYEDQLAAQRTVSFSIYRLLMQADQQLKESQQQVQTLEKEITGSHRISKKASR